MLILTRKLGEGIAIGDRTRVVVLGIRGRQVRLGIEAPEDVVVHREEIYLKIQEEQKKTNLGPIDGVIHAVKEKFTKRPRA